MCPSVLIYMEANYVLKGKTIVVTGVAFHVFQADISKEEDVLRLADQICSCGEIYGLVNNACVYLFEDFFDATPESYNFTFNVNVKAVFLLTQKIAKKMAKDGVQGRIVNFSSITSLSGSATQVHYGAAKVPSMALPTWLPRRWVGTASL